MLKFGLFEKSTKFEKIFHLKFDTIEERQILSGRFFQIMCPSQNVQTLKDNFLERTFVHKEKVQEPVSSSNKNFIKTGFLLRFIASHKVTFRIGSMTGLKLLQSTRTL